MATSPMNRLRNAIIDAAREQMDMIDELSYVERELIAAWNAVAEVEHGRSVRLDPITPADYTEARD